jgi:ADP-ribosyl-[dinitrogen reductase] hydrolase
MGAPLEGLPPPIRQVREMSGGGPFHRRRGHTTDDTLLALAIARSIIARKGFSPADVLDRLLHAYLQDPEFFGPTSSAFFSLLLTGEPPEDAVRIVHARQGSRSNGSVMRGIPLGIYFRDAVVVREVSIVCSELTHFDPVAGESSAFLNVMVSEMCRGRSRDRAFRVALVTCRNKEVGAMLGKYWEREPEPSLDALLAAHCALSIFMEAPGFEETVVQAINRGGDADTIGAVAGGLAGACWGMQAIPLTWMEDLKGQPAILEVAMDLCQVAEP